VGYTIDRWRLEISNASGSVTVDSGLCTLTATLNNNLFQISQKITSSDLKLDGKTVTF
jgi:hypothetical protein